MVLVKFIRGTRTKKVTNLENQITMHPTKPIQLSTNLPTKIILMTIIRRVLNISSIVDMSKVLQIWVL